MKRIIDNLLLILVVAAVALTTSSCEDFLDKTPLSDNLTEDDIYSNYTNVSLFLDGAYKWCHNDLEINSLQNAYAWNPGIADECANTYNSNGISSAMNTGNWAGPTISGFEIGTNGTATINSDSASIIFRSYYGIRICNAVIDNYTRVSMTDDEKNKLLGQAYLLRAWHYFQLIRRYGGMPDLTKLYEEITEYDQPRLTYKESTDLIVADCDMAISCLPDQWEEANVGRATKVSAMGVKSMALLYAASPLMQSDDVSQLPTSSSYNTTIAIEAAAAADAAIQYIEDTATNLTYGYRLSLDPENSTKYYNSPSSYDEIFVWENGTYYNPEESLWYNRDSADDMPNTYRMFMLPEPWSANDMDGSSGFGGTRYVYGYNAPTQNMVDLFERKGSDGNYYPITDSRSGYSGKPALSLTGDTEYENQAKVNDMYVDRDPRLHHNILVPGANRGVWVSDNSVPIYNTLFYYYDGSEGHSWKSQYGSGQVNINTRQQTGYIINKFVWETCGANPAAGLTTQDYTTHRSITSYVRVAHMYLNYAEAMYEATGSYDTNTVDGHTFRYTARQALNRIRKRGGITEWGGEGFGDTFRTAYRRERAIEFMFEFNRWFDIRRWMIFGEVFPTNKQYPIQGVRAQLQSDKYTEGSSYDSPINGTVYDLDPTVDGVIQCYPFDLTVEVRAYTDRNYWYPFPSDNVNSLKNLVQNPLW